LLGKKTIWIVLIIASILILGTVSPAFAGGHVIIDKAQMIKHLKKGEIDVKIEVTAKIPKDKKSSFGWALLGWDKVLVLVTHVPAFDDSDFDDKKGAFHTHVLSLTDVTDCTSGLKIDTGEAVTDPGYKNKVGNDNIEIKEVPLSDLGAPTGPPKVTGFFINDDGEADSLCVNTTGLVDPEIRNKND